MYDYNVMKNAAKRKYTIFDRVFTLTVFESDDIFDIKRYLQAVINDFDEDALSDTVIVSKDDGVVLPEDLLQWLKEKCREEEIPYE